VKQAIKSIQSFVHKLRLVSARKPAPLPQLQEEKTVWLTANELGTVQTVQHDGQEIKYRVPLEIADTVTLRFKGYSRTISGILLVHLKVDRGHDVHIQIWLSKNQATRGGQFDMHHEGRAIVIPIPVLTNDGQIIRLTGRGKLNENNSLSPRKVRGDLLIKCCVYPDSVVPIYRTVDKLTDDTLALEGWIYRRTEYILNSLSSSPLSLASLTAEQITDVFNNAGWKGIANLLIDRLNLKQVKIDFEPSTALSQPGRIQTMSRDNKIVSGTIYIKTTFLDDPFAVTAILGHELCHLIEARYLSQRDLSIQLVGKDLMEMERTVDLLVFLYQLGEFQLRVARNRLLTLGYFNQELFERVYVIASRKKNSHANS
jgi:hypothetical protein